MTDTAPRRLRALAFTAASLAALTPGAASAAQLTSPTTLTRGTVTVDRAASRSCVDAPLDQRVGVVRKDLVMPVSGVLGITLKAASGDWDVAAFDRATGRLVAGGAGYGADEVAAGFVGQGRDVLVQACRRSGTARTAELSVTALGIPTGTAASKPSLVEIPITGREQVSRLAELGFDLTEHVTAEHVQAVLYGTQDFDRLRKAGFTAEVVVEDLVKQLALTRGQDRRATARATRAGSGFRQAPADALPSGRTEYRRLVDYEAEMKQLVEKYPGLVRPITLPFKTVEGREVKGVEIAKDVNASDGRPTFMQMGVHHAREWPSGEHAMEWAVELATKAGKDAKIDDLLGRVRMVIVPVVNVDGFNVSREAPTDLQNDPQYAQVPDTGLNQTAVYLVDPALNYKRRNCRLTEATTSLPAGVCALPANRLLGVDPNRNYGVLWGGGGASALPAYDTFRGYGPFSENETQNVRAFISQRQVTTLITNHTFSNLVLRPPGVRSQGDPADEPAMKALGDLMATRNGYASGPSYGLYDTTGSTEDWSYSTTGGFGYTFEIGEDATEAEGGGFHPAFANVIRHWNSGSKATTGHVGGNRAAYLDAATTAGDRKQHSLITGRAPAGVTLRLKKEVVSETSPVRPLEADLVETPAGMIAGPVQTFPDVLESRLEITKEGDFAWDVNPSTRPFVDQRTFPGVANEPARSQDIAETSSTTPNQVAGEGAEGTFEDVRFDVTEADAAALLRVTVSGVLPVDDYDIVLFKKEGTELKEVGSSGAAPGSPEEIVLATPAVGDYVLRVNNYLGFGGWTGKVERFKQGQATIKPRSVTESYTLDCLKGDQVVATQKVEVERGRTAALGAICGANAAEVTGATPNGASCAATSGFKSVGVTPRSASRIGLTFVRRVSAPVRVDVFRVTEGRRVLGNRRVASFSGLTKSVTWNGRANSKGRRMGDGVYYARFTIKAGRRTDVRRVTLVRSGGRFRVRPIFYRPDSCGLLASAKLELPAFGGTANRSLGIAYRVARSSTVTVAITRGARKVSTRTFTSRAARRTYRLKVPAKGLPRGLYAVKITAVAGTRRATTTLRAERR